MVSAGEIDKAKAGSCMSMTALVSSAKVHHAAKVVDVEAEQEARSSLSTIEDEKLEEERVCRRGASLVG